MKAWRDEENLYASVIAKNTGKWEGSEVVQMYVGAADSKVERPEYVLKALQKIRLDAGEDDLCAFRFVFGDVHIVFHNSSFFPKYFS